MTPHTGPGCLRAIFLSSRPAGANRDSRTDEPRRLAAFDLRPFLVRHSRANQVCADEADRLGRKASGEPLDQRIAAPLVLAIERQAREHFAAEHARADAVAAPAHAVHDVPPSTEPSEDRQAVRRAVDRPRPVVRDRHLAQAGVRAAKVGFDRAGAPERCDRSRRRFGRRARCPSLPCRRPRGRRASRGSSPPSSGSR